MKKDKEENVIEEERKIEKKKNKTEGRLGRRQIQKEKQSYLELSRVGYETVYNFVGVGRICFPEHGGSMLFRKIDSYLKTISLKT
jgi:hypothetical protein